MPTQSARPPAGHFGIACTPAYRKWLGRFATANDVEVSGLVELALKAYASGRGHPAPPDRLATRRRRRFGVPRAAVDRRVG
ncbi:MAG: hypothetical protein P4L85_02680 [Paludisphaera borealis]|uniref:hypothetical protein n=1 Tax=Paludisphaera borealis TaxID=1387353 RepID=UPI002849A722|nr:hypothetical protein [Paludisphaera borealis]MDR3618227.1 hypothetical protein [Paludisphaera borealis]